MKKFLMIHWPLGAFILSVLLGGFNAIGVRYTVLELPPYWGAALRMAPAGLLLFMLVFVLKLPFPRGKALLGAIVYGALNFGLSFALLYFGLKKVLPGMSMIIMVLVPFFTMMIAIAAHQEKLRWRALLGALLAIVGIALVFQDQVRSQVPLTSLLAVILGAACFAGGSVVAKGLPKSHPITTNAIGMSAGAVILFLMSVLWNEPLALPVKTATWIGLIYLIFFGTCIVFILSLNILKRWPASTLSYQFVLLPFVTLTASAWITHETLSPVLLIGAALALLGIFFGVLSPDRKRKKEQACA